jgi:DNA-binding NtrC family response regulator
MTHPTFITTKGFKSIACTILALRALHEEDRSSADIHIQSQFSLFTFLSDEKALKPQLNQVIYVLNLGEGYQSIEDWANLAIHLSKLQIKLVWFTDSKRLGKHFASIQNEYFQILQFSSKALGNSIFEKIQLDLGIKQRASYFNDHKDWCEDIEKDDLKNPGQQSLEAAFIQSVILDKFRYAKGSAENDEKILTLIHQFSNPKFTLTAEQKFEAKYYKETGEWQLVGANDLIKKLVKLGQDPGFCRVLILGESGTGKEAAAKYIHDSSLRRKKEFVAVNCSAFTSQMMESTLFGHKKGAFTGAIDDHKGWISVAEGGTLFLDEIGELDLDLQARLLRFIQEDEYFPLGSTEVKKANVRIVAATNRNLKQLIAEGKFREDLYYRIAQMIVRTPSFRDLGIDDQRRVIGKKMYDFNVERSFLNHSLNNALPENQTEEADLTEDDFTFIHSQNWPGNVRQLENILRRFVIFKGDVRVQDLYKEEEYDSREASEDVEDFSIIHALGGEPVNPEELLHRYVCEVYKYFDGVKKTAYESIQMSRNTFEKHLSKNENQISKNE